MIKLIPNSKIKSKLKKIKTDKTDKVNGKKHFSVGALIKQGNKYLIINRNLYPSGYAGTAGHIQKNETPSQALKREIKEETGYNLVNKKLLFHKVINGNECRTGFNIHEWFLYECKCNGKLKISKKEVKSIKFMTKEKIKKLYKNKKLEPVWEYWFKKLKII